MSQNIICLFMTLSVTQNIGYWMTGKQWTTNGEGCSHGLIWGITLTYAWRSWAKPLNTAVIIVKCPDWDGNQDLPEFKSQALLLELTYCYIVTPCLLISEFMYYNVAYNYWFLKTSPKLNSRYATLKYLLQGVCVHVPVCQHLSHEN
jgi:hypothetical protein